jgi:hypothetical protein
MTDVEGRGLGDRMGTRNEELLDRPETAEGKAALDEHDFEGTLVLEKLASLDGVDAFLEAVDADDFARASALMKRAGVDPGNIAIVLKRMNDPDGNH